MLPPPVGFIENTVYEMNEKPFYHKFSLSSEAVITYLVNSFLSINDFRCVCKRDETSLCFAWRYVSILCNRLYLQASLKTIGAYRRTVPYTAFYSWVTQF